MFKFEIGRIHQSGENWYMHAFLQADSIDELVKIRENSCNSHGSVIYRVDYSKSMRVKEEYGMTRLTVSMPLVVEKIGHYFEQTASSPSGLESMEQPVNFERPRGPRP